MNINFTGHNVEITSSIKEMTLEKFKKIQRHFDHITNAHVIFDVNKARHTVEMTLHVPGEELIAKAESDDMYKALDEVILKLDRQIIKHKEKQQDHHRGEKDHHQGE